MRIALDTNRYADLCRNVPEALRIVQSAERVFVPFVVLAELRAGFAYGTRAVQNERVLIRFLNEDRVETLYADEQTTHHYGQLFAFLRRQGTPIPSNDLWIASLVVQHDLVLCARDKHYEHLPQLPRV